MKRKRPAWKRIIIPLEIYPFTIIVSINEQNKQVREYLLKQNISGAAIEDAVSYCDGAAAAISNVWENSNHALIRMRTYPDTATLKGHLSHEIFHVVSQIMEAVGMKLLCRTSCEAYAYLMGYITEQVYKKIQE